MSTHLSQVEAIRVMKHDQNTGKSKFCWEFLHRPPLYEHMVQVRDQFDDQNDLGGLSFIKTWGIASFNRYVAACITLHPGDMPEYITPSQERAMIVFYAQGANNSNSESEYTSWQTDSIAKDNIQSSQSKILKTVFELEHHQKYEFNELSNRIIYAAAIAASLVWDDERPRRLVEAADTLQRLEKSAEIDITLELEALRKLQRSGLGINQEIATIKTATGSKSSDALSLRSVQNLLDICPFCAEVIPWEDLKEASCMRGHQFGMLQPGLLDTEIDSRCFQLQ